MTIFIGTEISVTLWSPCGFSQDWVQGKFSPTNSSLISHWQVWYGQSLKAVSWTGLNFDLNWAPLIWRSNLSAQCVDSGAWCSHMSHLDLDWAPLIGRSNLSTQCVNSYLMAGLLILLLPWCMEQNSRLGSGQSNFLSRLGSSFWAEY